TFTAAVVSDTGMISIVANGDADSCLQVKTTDVSSHKRLCVADLKKATAKLERSASNVNLDQIFSPAELEVLVAVTQVFGKATTVGKTDVPSSPCTEPTCPSSNQQQQQQQPKVPQGQDLMTPNTSKQEENTVEKEVKEELSSPSPEAGESPDDRRARLIVETMTDYDCTDREFDALSDDFDLQEAVLVYHKCRILVIKNVFTPEQMALYKHLTEDFVVGLHHGQVDKHATLVGPKLSVEEQEQNFHSERSQGKWEVIHPGYFLTRGGRDFALNEVVYDILHDPLILGDEAGFGGSGALLNEPYTDAGRWHTDAGFLFGDDSHGTTGIAGHDIPSAALNLATPFAELRVDSGLTEYCVGTSHLAGVGYLKPSKKWQLNESFQEMYAEHLEGWQRCPPSAWRVPAVKPGDVIIWDYLIRHRAGANLSNQTRPLLFTTFGRDWYGDGNFEPYRTTSDEDLFLTGRFSADVDDPYEGCEDDDDSEDEEDEDDDYMLFECPPPTTKLIEKEQGLMEDIGKLMMPNFDKETRKQRQEWDNGKGRGQTILVALSNKDVPDAKFIINGGQNDERMAEVPMDDYEVIRLKVGTDITVTSGDKVVQQWKITPNSHQILISKQSVGL
ncbi:MAG: hypothetical protein SGILL_009031, partial [Bacillariaceae sp.]